MKAYKDLKPEEVAAWAAEIEEALSRKVEAFNEAEESHIKRVNSLIEKFDSENNKALLVLQELQEKVREKEQVISCCEQIEKCTLELLKAYHSRNPELVQSLERQRERLRLELQLGAVKARLSSLDMKNEG